MGMVVLHGNQRDRQVCSQLSRKTGRAIVRVEIAGDGPWCDMKQLLEILDCLPECPVRFQGRKVTEMLTEQDAITCKESDGILEMPTHGKDRTLRHSIC